MATSTSSFRQFLLFCFLILPASADFEGVVGVNYGLLGNDLPEPEKVVALYKERNISSLRLFTPNHDVLNALRGSDICVVVGTLNQDLEKLAADPAFAAQWIQTNVLSYSPCVRFRYVVAGNEVVPGDLQAHVLPAMKNLRAAILAAGLSVPVTTAISTQVLGSSFPPSSGMFSELSAPFIGPIVNFLATNCAPLLVNIYPYFAFSGDPQNVPLDYALFGVQSTATTVQDGPLKYTNLFDAEVDSVYSALEKLGGGSVDIVVSETGWPSAGGGLGATVENAEAYNNRVVAHVQTGTPKRPGKPLETYLFAMFNENQKPQGVERNFGLFRPDMTEVYHVEFSQQP